ncbi:MAG: DUF4058 family protein [bacterium]
MPFHFHGMDPWLERPGLWPDVHDSLILALRRMLTPLVRPHYYIAVRQRSVLAVSMDESVTIYPDVSVVESGKPARRSQKSAPVTIEPIVVEVPVMEAIQEDYLEIMEAQTHRVVTVIEVLSPSNKQPGEDRRAYEAKRERLFRTLTNFVEIDLLRDWEPMPFTFLQTNGKQSHYRLLIKRGEHPQRAFLYPFNLQDAIPSFHLPLQSGDQEPLVQLDKLLREIYDEGAYDLRVDYSQPPVPPLNDEDLAWVQKILRQK